MKSRFLVILLQAALLAGIQAQNRGEALLIRPEEQQAVQRQTIEFFDAIRPASQEAVRSTVWIWARIGRENKPVVYGTVVEDGSKVLTKWSEIAMAQGDLQVVGGDGRTAKATVLGVHQDEDLALLQLEGASFPPVAFSTDEAPSLGRFIIAASPDETPASVGVVGVEARSLRDKDQAFLGVVLDPKFTGKGVKIVDIAEGGAASEAGLKAKDVILSLGGREVGSLLEMQTALAGHIPGDEVEIRYARKGTDAAVDVVLKEKTESFPEFPNDRLRQMERMGTRLSLVRSGFPRVIQTDMQLDRDRVGGPVVDLDGKVIGIAIARADRTRSFVIPSKSILEILGRNPVAPDLARATLAEQRAQRRQVGQRPGGSRPPGRAVPPPDPGAADRMRAHLEEMQLLMERMREEMEAIDGR